MVPKWKCCQWPIPISNEASGLQTTDFSGRSLMSLNLRVQAVDTGKATLPMAVKHPNDAIQISQVYLVRTYNRDQLNRICTRCDS